MKQKILFCCGDRSADNYLKILLEHISQYYPEIIKLVVGGEKSKTYADVFIEDLVSYDAHGFYSPFQKFFKFIYLYNKIKSAIINEDVKLVVLMDYYGFNIKLAKLAKKYKIKVVYYITPQVWASRIYRIKKIKRYVDCVINIYPFEQKIFLSYGIPSFYFGHPICDIFNTQQIVNNNENRNILALFPGSREQVIKWNLPVMVQIANYYLKKYENNKIKQVVIFGFDKYQKIYNKIIDKYIANKENKELFYIASSENEELRKKVAVAISVSGTVVLENIFYNTPTIVIYNLPTPMYLFLKNIVYVNYISLPNIILNKEVIPEFIKEKISITKICEIIHLLVTNDNARAKFLKQYEELKKMLKSNDNVSKCVAQKIIECLYEKD